MRNAVLKSVHRQMSENKNIYFLTGDLGYTAVEQIENDFPERFINTGIAEQNMIGVAAGMAASGKKVFIYSIIPFVTMRCYEQIRNDLCYHNLNVKIIGVGSGLSYGLLGNTHFSTEDMGIMRCLPNMTIISPADSIEALLATDKIFQIKGPVYLRIGKKGEPKVYEKPYDFKFGIPVTLQEGNDLIILSTGTILPNVLEAAKILKEKYKIQCKVVNIHTIKPLDKKNILKICLNKSMVFTIEEHGIIGGLGGTVLEILSGEKNLPPVKLIGIRDEFIKHIGTQEYLREKMGLDPEGIIKTILRSYHGK